MSNVEQHGGSDAAGQTPAPPQGISDPRDPQQRTEIQIEDAHALTSYANFCRVTGTPEELIIDFGLNSQPSGVPSQPIVITQRIVTNLFTAKRLLQVLQLTVQRHEATFGALETDVQRRMRRT
jgi:hypothetical protein